jgi:hypothetical protein
MATREIDPYSPNKQVILFVAALAAGLLATPLLDASLRAGLNMAPHDLATDYVTGALWATALAVGILLWPVPFVDRCVLFALWIVKAAVALGFMLLYESTYSSLDAFGYYMASTQAQFDWSQTGWGNGTSNLMALAWLHGRFIPNSYHALKISFAMIGLIAAYIFYRSAIAAGAKTGVRLLALLVLTPSVLFWSSIVGKDPIILLGIAVYTYGVVRWVRGRTTYWLLVALVGVVTASLIRLWLGPILILPVIVVAMTGERSAWQRVLILAMAVAAFLFAVSIFKDKFFQESTVDILDAANTYSQSWARGGSAQVLATPFSGIGSMIRFIPLGVFTALLRPLPGEVRNSFGLLAGLENAALLLLTLLAIWRTRVRDFRNPLVLWAATLVVTWSVVYGFVSYQNLGTSVRFRLQILPVFLLLLIHLARGRGQRDTVKGLRVQRTQVSPRW